MIYNMIIFLEISKYDISLQIQSLDMLSHILKL